MPWCTQIHIRSSVGFEEAGWMAGPGTSENLDKIKNTYLLIHAISRAPFQVHHYSEALLTEHGYCVDLFLEKNFHFPTKNS